MKSVSPKELVEHHSPLYRRIELDLRERVQRGQWPAGYMLPSRKSLAQEYGVDMRTLQRAIGDLLADGTLTAHGGRGTFVAGSSSSTNSEQPRAANSLTNTIAIIAEQSFSPGPTWLATIQTVHEAVRKSLPDAQIITLNTYDRTPEGVARHERNALEIVENERLAGVIMAHAGGAETLPDIRRVLATGVPIVFIDRLPFDRGCDFVGIGNRFAAQDLVEYLTSIGHKRIGFLAPDETVTTIEDRLAGYHDAMRTAQLDSPEEYIFRLPLARSYAMESLKTEINRVASEIMSMDPRPTAMFVVNDFLAEYFVVALEQMGHSVPESLSVVGFDDLERYLPRTPKLTTVRQPFEQIGERAAAMLLSRIRAVDDPANAYQHVLLPTRLVIRTSTTPTLA